MERKIKRGANFVMTQELFDDMLEKYLGFERGSIETWDVTSQHHMRAIEISIVTNDERFPIVTEGSRFPTITPIVSSVKVSDDPLRFEARFNGFSDIVETRLQEEIKKHEVDENGFYKIPRDNNP